MIGLRVGEIHLEIKDGVGTVDLLFIYNFVNVGGFLHLSESQIQIILPTQSISRNIFKSIAFTNLDILFVFPYR